MMTIIRKGATKKYAAGWEQAFGKGGKTAKAEAGDKTLRPTKKKRAAKKKHKAASKSK
jgi:hypothetical protein